MDRPVSKIHLARLLWATQGVSDPVPGRGRLRTAPSAGALYPLDLYVVVGRVDEIPSGVYFFQGSPARLIPLRSGDWRSELAAGCLGQSHVSRAALCLIWTAVPERTTVKYGTRGWRYLYLEAGHQAQNLQLAATALDLSCCPVGAFHDDALGRLLGLDPVRCPILYVGAVGPGGS